MQNRSQRPSKYHGYGGKPKHGPTRSPYQHKRPFNRGYGGGHTQKIDVSRYVNKAVITEEVEKFIPEHRFADFVLDERVKKNIADKGYTDPTPIQDRAIPHVLRGADVALLGRILDGARNPIHGELLSYLFFAREFIHELIQLGRRDAERWLAAPHDDGPWQHGRMRSY